MANKYYTYLLMAALMIIMAACTSDSDVEVTDEEGNTEETSTGGDLVASYATDVSSLDPAGQNDLPSDQRRNVIYEGLLYLNDELEPEPRLATDYEQTAETTWVFNLREGVQFHDGTELNAEAVKANIERIVDPAVASSRANIFEMIEEINVVDDYTVEIITEYPFAALPNYLAHDAGGMVSKAVIDEDYQNALDEAELDMTLDEFYEQRAAGGAEYEETANEVGRATGTIVEQKPVGTGYMQFQSRSPGENVVVERFDDYWDEPAKLDTITFKVVAEDASRIAELESGQSHFIQGFDNAQWERIENHPEMETHPVYNLSNEYVGMNTQKGPLEDKRVRQAIGHMVDKDTIMEGIYYGVGRTMKGALQEEILGYNEDLEDLEYNPERAKELLEEAGYGDGFDLTIMTNDTPERVDLAIYLQEELKEVGINLSIEQLEWGAYLEAVSNGEHDLFILGWPNPVGDPDQGIWPLFHSSMQGTAGNRSFFDNAEVDELLEQGRRELDDAKREEIYQEIDKILVEEQPAVFIRQSQSANAARTEVEGLYISHFNKPDFRNVTINEQ
ncbi:glutathione ABC transporter substrate-binding protein [Jeotgalicoccus psychrophilus]|uniref:glutathione ABC transporter substrate-binding protein n=1 Tax=Jeotgalicoccus psychrophilus TaxID=157228 RepID=UPI000406742C|nr:glutathione ABC transporter substrate-binding protein [Jeotgalicoccus psychrophilus]